MNENIDKKNFKHIELLKYFEINFLFLETSLIMRELIPASVATIAISDKERAKLNFPKLSLLKRWMI